MEAKRKELLLIAIVEAEFPIIKKQQEIYQMEETIILMLISSKRNMGCLITNRLNLNLILLIKIQWTPKTNSNKIELHQFKDKIQITEVIVTMQGLNTKNLISLQSLINQMHNSLKVLIQFMIDYMGKRILPLNINNLNTFKSQRKTM